MGHIGTALGRNRLRTLMILVACLSAVLMVLTVGGMRWLRTAADRRLVEVQHAREVIARAYGLARDASLAQTNDGLFALTHDTRAARSHERAVADFRTGLAQLSRLVSGDPEQAARVLQIGGLFEDLARDAISQPTAFEFAVDRRTKAVKQMTRMDALQAALDGLVTQQTGVMVGSTRASEQLNRSIDLAALLATSLVVSWAIASIFLFRRIFTLPLTELRASAEAITRGDLDRRVAVRRPDELGRLAVAFNRMADQLRLQRRANDALRELRELMHGVQDLDEIDRILALLVPDCLPDTSGRLFLLDHATDHLVPRGGWGTEEAAPPFPAGECWALRLGRRHEVTPEHATLPCPHLPAGTAGSVCFPLGGHGAVHGVLVVTFSGPAPRGITEIGETLALALANVRLRDEMREEAQLDPLTSLFNRRYLERAAREITAHALETGTPFSLALLDVDHFKDFNDVHGHQAGDAVLRALGARLRESCRGSDVASRYGGEEFVLLLPGCALDDGLRRAEQIRAEVAAMSVLDAGRPLGRVTVSIGVAAFPASGRDGADLLAAADRALYRSKAEGRDRVTGAPPLALVPAG